MRHIVTNVLVDIISGTEARGTNYLTLLSSPASLEPPQEAGALHVGGFEDQHVRTAEGMTVQEPDGRVVLHQGGAMPNIPAPSAEARGLQ